MKGRAKLKSDLIYALRSPWVQLTLFASFIFRLIFFSLYLPKTPSAFGPDEGTYAKLASFVAENSPVEEFPIFGPALYNSSRSLIVPSSALVRLGLNDLYAVRAISSIYGLLTSLFIILCVVAILQRRNRGDVLRDFRVSLVFPVFLFSFLPSNFLWSTLGLRESASQFWIIATFYFLLKVHFGLGKSSFLYFIPASTSLVLAFGARKETALVATMTALIAGIFVAIMTRNVNILGVAALGLIGGQMFTAVPQVKAVEVFYLEPTQNVETKSPNPTQNVETKSPNPTQNVETKSPNPTQNVETKSPNPTQNVETKSPKPSLKAPVGVCIDDNQTIQLQSGDFICTKLVETKREVINPIESTKNQFVAVKALEETRKVRSIDAQSALPEGNCKNYESQIQRVVLCSLKELPYRLSSFLLRPFPIIDSGSQFFSLAGLENIIWMLLLLTVIYLVYTVRTSKTEKFIVFGLMFYVFSFSSLASLYEGNLGTAFRHKSSILWPLVTIFIVLITQKKRQRV